MAAGWPTSPPAPGQAGAPAAASRTSPCPGGRPRASRAPGSWPPRGRPAAGRRPAQRWAPVPPSLAPRAATRKLAQLALLLQLLPPDAVLAEGNLLPLVHPHLSVVCLGRQHNGPLQPAAIPADKRLAAPEGHGEVAPISSLVNPPTPGGDGGATIVW